MDARSSSGVAGVFSLWFDTYCLFSPPKSGMYRLQPDNFPSHTIIKTDTTTRKIQTRAKFYLPDSCCENKNRIQ